MDKLIIATRGSRLALAQAGWVAAQLRRVGKGRQVELDIIKTKGDRILDVPLAQVGGKGLFVKEIEDALLERRAHLAVHSMKDMPTELPPGLIIGAIPERENPHDVMVSRGQLLLKELPTGARIGTSSLRRQAQLLARRPDFQIVSIRGNVETRLRKLSEEDLDAVVLAQAGLNRLELNDVQPEVLPPDVLLPAVGQGALALECREDDPDTLAILSLLHHPPTAWTVAAERAFLARLEGGCQVPIAGHAVLEPHGLVRLAGLVASLDGKQVVRGDGISGTDDTAQLGVQVAEEVLAGGGREILAEVYGEKPA
ncbi:MAG: hydroxymethylbilane synthase [Deltaproteobacteria bacterium]|nr:hydroxymethylbilane synthase [Deltaproteobacteria bacterium]